MRILLAAVVAILLSESAPAAEPLQWVKKPELTFDDKAKKWYATFEIDALTDVEVALIDPLKNIVIRHLAAGVLGPKAPPPLAQNSRAQRLEWDGKDDYHQPVANPEKLAVRVRAGMSVELKQIVGGDPYMYLSPDTGGHWDHGPWGIYGLELKSDGKVYVLGHSSNLGPPALRQYDIDGNYLRTVFPPPASKDVKAMKGWGINVKSDGTYTPKFNQLADPSLSTTILDTTLGMARLFPTPDPNRLSLWDTRGTFEMMTLNTDGTIPDPAEQMQGPLVKSPPLPAGVVEGHTLNAFVGPVFTGLAPDGKHFYLSGAFAAKTLYGSIKGIDTNGYWRDGQVWKVDLEARTAKLFFALDEQTVAKAKINRSYSESALHGVAADKDGNVFVCDRVNKRILVLDDSGKLKREIPVEHPDAIAVSSRTAAVYVTTRAMGVKEVRLLKFADWRKDDEPVASMVVSDSNSRFPQHYSPSYLAVCEKDNSSNVWVAYTVTPVRIYKDDDKGLTLLKDFLNMDGAQRCAGFDRLEVDQRTGDAFVLDDHYAVWKVSNWDKPQFVKLPLSTGSVAIDSRNRYLYAKPGNTAGLSRFQLDQEKYPPANVGDSGSNLLTGPIWNEWCFTGRGDMGFAIAPNGNLAAIDQKGNLLFFQGDEKKLPWESTILAKTGIMAAGVQFDFAGNLYVGFKDKPVSEKNIPSGFEGDRWVADSCGRIHKYSPTGTLESGNLFPKVPAGPSLTYDVLYGGFHVDCIVRGPRFYVDGFGRIYYPTNILPRVSVMDNAGNEILHFGTYGNRDSMGGLPGDLVPTKGIPLGFPNSVAATDDYIYVADMVNQRLLRIQKEFQAAATSQ